MKVTPGTGDGRGFDVWIASICVARVLMYANFMVYSACLPALLGRWDMTATQAGTVASGFMIGYAASLFACSWLADRFGSRNVFRVSAVASAVTALLFGFGARSYESALLLYTLAATTQGGLYTPAIVLFAERYPPARRGMAVGYLIASTSVGYAASLVVSGLCLQFSGYELAFVLTGVMPVLGATVTWLVLRSTPNRIHPRPPKVSVWRVLKERRNAAWLVAGYTCHSWELLGMWSWTPAFFAAAYLAAGVSEGGTAQFGAYLTAGMHLVGSMASATTGRLSDRFGRRRLMLVTAVTAALLSFTLGWTIGWPLWLLTGLGLVYYFCAIGDSPVNSTALSESVDFGYLGSVLAMRALLGFSAGAVAPVAFGAVLDLFDGGAGAGAAWGWAFAALGVGGAGAAWCAWHYRPPVGPVDATSPGGTMHGSPVTTAPRASSPEVARKSIEENDR